MRKSLFTPLDVAPESQGGISLGRTRVTKGITQNWNLFEIRDDWTDPCRAHRKLNCHWIGSTTFITDKAEVACKSSGLCSVTDSADGDKPPSVRWRQGLVRSGLDLAEKRVLRFFEQQRQGDDQVFASMGKQYYSA